MMNTEVYRLVDSHAHLDEIEDIERAILDAKQVGVVALIAVGQDYESNLKVLELSEKYESFVYPALGLHPWSLGNMDAAQIALNLRHVEDNIERVVAIGEVGLDYHKRVRAVADKERQREAFKAMLDLARRYDKPVSVHSRYSWKDSFDLVKESAVEKAVFHWYTGFSNVLREIIAEGYFISATPAGEYHDEHRRAIKETPLESLLLETDSPVSYGRETRYESRPSDIIRSLKAVAQIKGLEESIVAQRTTSNAIRLFGLTA
ncbi:MAG: TatD family hydrolase [Dehalococcoidia bacterium]|nr:TatD family hydrolase [Dehalococcoidia bacterium]